MIIKNLWVINAGGLCTYSYKANFSDYKIDETMFGGFISALVSFTETLSQKNIRFLKLEEDELYFRDLKDIIVVSIMNTAGAEQTVIDQMLQFIGEKFLESYSESLKSPTFDWSSIIPDFTKEMNYVLGDEELYEEMKRELINNLLQDIMSGKQPPDVLTWKISYLFADSKPDEIIKTIEMIDQVTEILPTLRYDAILESKITDAFYKAKVQLSTKLIKDRNQLFVLCSDTELFNKVFKNFLAFGTLCIQHKDYAGLIKSLQSIFKANLNLTFNILLLTPLPSKDELTKLKELHIEEHIYVWELRESSDNMTNFISKSGFKLTNAPCSLDHSCPKVFNLVYNLNKFQKESIENLLVK
jgi:hypothetical protein